MSTAAPPEVSAAAAGELGIADIARARWEAFKGGDVGSVPVIVGIIAITIFFTAKTSIFFTAVNFSNLIGQMAGVTVIAVGIVFVLLIGEIDLSVGYVSGIGSVAVAEFQKAGSSHDYPGLVAIGLAVGICAAIGAAQGSIIAFLGVPSFVVTLAGLLIAQGMIIYLLGNEGVIGIQDHQIRHRQLRPQQEHGLDRGNRVHGALAIGSFGTYFSRRRAGLPTGNLLLTVGRVVFFGGLAFATVAVCNHSRGVPLVGLVMVFVVGIFSYLAARTTFGRHVYAVGGNAEAARRAGVNVKLIRGSSVFTISGAMRRSRRRHPRLAPELGRPDLRRRHAPARRDLGGCDRRRQPLRRPRPGERRALRRPDHRDDRERHRPRRLRPTAIKYVTTGTILLAAVTLDTVARRRQVAAGR